MEADGVSTNFCGSHVNYNNNNDNLLLIPSFFRHSISPDDDFNLLKAEYFCNSNNNATNNISACYNSVGNHPPFYDTPPFPSSSDLSIVGDPALYMIPPFFSSGGARGGGASVVESSAIPLDLQIVHPLRGDGEIVEPAWC